MVPPRQPILPRAIRAGDLIAVTAPSSGVPPAMHPRLDLVLEHLRAQGFRVVEGSCLRAEGETAKSRSASAPRDDRDAELLRFLEDPEVAAIIPPWGGELATELLTRIDFEELRSQRPKWLLGYSDTSTLLLPLTLITGWATAHGPNLMDMVHTQTDALTTGTLGVLGSDFSAPVHQASAPRFQPRWRDFAAMPDAPLDLTEPVEWKRLDGSNEALTMCGRLIGGCLDTVSLLAGSPYGDVPGFVERAGSNGVILYLENVDLSPGAMVRTLLSLERHGWLRNLTGLAFGRSARAPETKPNHLDYVGALRSVLGDYPFPVLYDVDVGHMPPQFTLINGAQSEWSFEDGGGTLVMSS